MGFMANQHKEKLRGVRQITDELWADFGDAAAQSGSDRSAITRAFYEWFVGRPGAHLPKRPTEPDD